MPQLTVHNAEVKTATVEIRTLTISGKQVTLAVFRQLKQEPLIADNGKFRGLPWGVVNYHTEKIQVTNALTKSLRLVPCESAGEHLHVVWQSGEELRRDLVQVPPGLPGRDKDWPAFSSDVTDTFAQASYCANGHKMPDWLLGGLERTFTVDGMHCQAELPTRHTYWQGNKEVQAPCPAPPDLPALRAAVASEKARRNRIHARWAELLKLPQLFIAV